MYTIYVICEEWQVEVDIFSPLSVGNLDVDIGTVLKKKKRADLSITKFVQGCQIS
jgi:hypothetical protein